MVKGRFWKKDRGRGSGRTEGEVRQEGRTEGVSMIMGRVGGRCTTGEGKRKGMTGTSTPKEEGGAGPGTPGWSESGEGSKGQSV